MHATILLLQLQKFHSSLHIFLVAFAEIQVRTNLAVEIAPQKKVYHVHLARSFGSIGILFELSH